MKSTTFNNRLTKAILSNCAPTITGMKPASLMNFNQANRLYGPWQKYPLQQFYNFLDYLDPGLKVYPQVIHHHPGTSVMVLFYNPGLLGSFLQYHENQQFLTAWGYQPSQNTIYYLTRLVENMKSRLLYGSFSHEIGVFLGIPPYDVQGFIENKGRNYVMNGYWKVYQNPERAKKIFAGYDQAKINLLAKGNLLHQVT